MSAAYQYARFVFPKELIRPD